MALKFFWGEISPQELQHVLSLFRDDVACLRSQGLDLTLVDTIAGIGFDGANPGSAKRDLFRALPKIPLAPVRSFRVPLNHSVYGSSEDDGGICDPHEMFATLYHSYPTSFWSYVVPSRHTLTEFWNAVSGAASDFVGVFKC